jgi:putative ABC transport system ATP-binding protein
MIELRGIGRTYEMGGRPVHALREVDLAIAPGDYLSLMGPSGSGKSTLLHILGLLDRPTEGEYRFEGRSTRDLSDAERSLLRRYKVGFVFQFFHLLPRLDALGNVALPMMLAGIPGQERATRAREALEKVGLAARAGHRPEELSGGERQRVAIARAIVMRPAMVLADEPTGNLDRTSAGEIIHLLESLNAEGLTLVMVTHDPELGKRARRTLRLLDGRVLAGDATA